MLRGEIKCMSFFFLKKFMKDKKGLREKIKGTRAEEVMQSLGED